MVLLLLPLPFALAFYEKQIVNFVRNQIVRSRIKKKREEKKKIPTLYRRRKNPFDCRIHVLRCSRSPACIPHLKLKVLISSIQQN